MRPLSLALAGALVLAPALAPAKTDQTTLDMTQPRAVAAAMQDRGFRAKLGRDSSDRPMIESGLGGIKFDVVFYHCSETGCLGALFTAGFDLDKGIGLEAMNSWNTNRLVGRAFVDEECDPFIDHYVSTDAGMTTAAFDSLLEDWEIALEDFADFIGFDDDESSVAVADCGVGGDAI